MEKTIPVYLFLGFLDSGKTHFMQENLCDREFMSGEKTLVVLCEEGEEELDPSQYKGGKNEAWQGNLKKAAETVSLFDASPDYGIENFRYASVTENMSIHDILGTTARESVDSILSAIKDPAFEVIWKEVSDHE